MFHPINSHVSPHKLSCLNPQTQVWLGLAAPLKHLKVYIKIVKQHAPKRVLGGIEASNFCCFSIKKWKARKKDVFNERKVKLIDVDEEKSQEQVIEALSSKVPKQNCAGRRGQVSLISSNTRKSSHQSFSSSTESHCLLPGQYRSSVPMVESGRLKTSISDAKKGLFC